MTKRVLNAGSGEAASVRLHPVFREPGWQETRLDIDAQVKPDIVGSFAELKGLVNAGEFDAIWSSHSLEHLHTHEVIPALQQFQWALKPDGFALITCPDLASVASFALKNGVETVAYVSGLGPIRPLDMIFGHARSIATGRPYMAHNTGFTAERLGRVALEAGFSEVRVMEGKDFDLWAMCLMGDADKGELARMFAKSNIESLFASDAL